MTTTATEVTVPDIGAFENVPIIEVHVKAGDQVNEEDPLITLESDKATMDVPAPLAGQVLDIQVKVGDEVSTGSPILTIGAGDGAVAPPPTLVEQQEPDVAEPPAAAPPARAPETAVTPQQDVRRRCRSTPGSRRARPARRGTSPGCTPAPASGGLRVNWAWT